MATFTITIDDSKKYLHLISGVTRLTPKETDVLAEIIKFMSQKSIPVIDDRVKDHVMKAMNFKNEQTYHNILSTFRKKKVLLHSHNKTELKKHLLPGTVLEIKFEAPKSELADFNAPTNETAKKDFPGKTKIRKHQRRAVS
jgi:hypothetical protein